MQLKPIALAAVVSFGIFTTVPARRVQASVVDPPTIAEAFNPSSILLNGTSTLTFTITNPAANGSTDSLGVAFTDVMPIGISPPLPFVSDTSLATPLPAALPLFATGLGAIGLLGWRRKRKARA